MNDTPKQSWWQRLSGGLKRSSASIGSAISDLVSKRRLDAATIGFIIDHAETKVLITDPEFAKTVKEALAIAKTKPLVIDYADPEFAVEGERLREGPTAARGSAGRSLVPQGPECQRPLAGGRVPDEGRQARQCENRSACREWQARHRTAFSRPSCACPTASKNYSLVGWNATSQSARIRS